MTTGSLLSEDLKRAIDYETGPTTVEVDKTLVSRFVSAIGDANPLWCDKAKAPPSLLCAAMMSGTLPWAHLNSVLPPRALDGGGEWEYFAPVVIGDQITIRSRLLDIAERQGKLGPMLILTAEDTYHNQRGELVARATKSAIRY